MLANVKEVSQTAKSVPLRFCQKASIIVQLLPPAVNKTIAATLLFCHCRFTASPNVRSCLFSNNHRHGLPIKFQLPFPPNSCYFAQCLLEAAAALHCGCNQMRSCRSFAFSSSLSWWNNIWVEYAYVTRENWRSERWSTSSSLPFYCFASCFQRTCWYNFT